MTAKTMAPVDRTAKAMARAAGIPGPGLTRADLWLTAPLTTEIRLERIRVMGQRIDGYIQLMCAATNPGGSSQEAKDKAVTLFYQSLHALEKQLDRIQEDFRLE